MVTSKYFGLVQHVLNNCFTDKQEASNKHYSSLSENTKIMSRVHQTGLGAITPSCTLTTSHVRLFKVNEGSVSRAEWRTNEPLCTSMFLHHLCALPHQLLTIEMVWKCQQEVGYFTSFKHVFNFLTSSFPVMSHLSCRPQNNGKFCSGSSRLNQLCNTRPCPLDAVDFRAQQCAEYNSKPFRGWYYKWKPYTKVDGMVVQFV